MKVATAFISEIPSLTMEITSEFIFDLLFHLLLWLWKSLHSELTSANACFTGVGKNLRTGKTTKSFKTMSYI